MIAYSNSMHQQIVLLLSNAQDPKQAVFKGIAFSLNTAVAYSRVLSQRGDFFCVH